MQIVLIVFILLLLVLYIVSKKNVNPIEWLFEPDKSKLSIVLPVGLFLFQILDPIIKFKKYKDKIYQRYGRHTFLQHYQLFMAERFAFSYLIILIFSVIALIMSVKGTDGLVMVNRPAFDEHTEYVNYGYEMNIDNQTFDGEITIGVNPLAPTYEEAQNYMEEIVQLVELQLCPKIEDVYSTYEDLNCPTEVGGVAIDWNSQSASHILNSGRIRTHMIDEPIMVTMEAKYQYYEVTIDKSYLIQLYKKPLSVDSLYLEKTLEEAVLEATDKSNQVVLPKTVYGNQVLWKDINDPYATVKILGIGILLGVIFFFLKAKTLDEHMAKRKEDIQMRLPGMINKIALLLQAGMTFKSAWIKVAEDYRMIQKKSGIRYELYEEMLITMNDMANGTAELQAYELFSRRISSKEVYRFIAIVTQNIKKGNHMLCQSLMELSYAAWQQREYRAKIKGEKASTKMVLPMSIMLVIIMIIIIVPALMQIQI